MIALIGSRGSRRGRRGSGDDVDTLQAEMGRGGQHALVVGVDLAKTLQLRTGQMQGIQSTQRHRRRQSTEIESRLDQCRGINGEQSPHSGRNVCVKVSEYLGNNGRRCVCVTSVTSHRRSELDARDLTRRQACGSARHLPNGRRIHLVQVALGNEGGVEIDHTRSRSSEM